MYRLCRLTNADWGPGPHLLSFHCRADTVFVQKKKNQASSRYLISINAASDNRLYQLYDAIHKC